MFARADLYRIEQLETQCEEIKRQIHRKRERRKFKSHQVFIESLAMCSVP
jgi:hypothetical protein